MEAIENSYRVLLWIGAVMISLMICACFVRAILGPRSTDRIISINVICTKVIILIPIVAYLLAEDTLLDVAIVYGMINFLAVVVLYKCYPIARRTDPQEHGHDTVDGSFYGKLEKRTRDDGS